MVDANLPPQGFFPVGRNHLSQLLQKIREKLQEMKVCEAIYTELKAMRVT